MGCDIHLHAEIKLDGQWHHYGLIDVPRNYALFGKMAGVRCLDETPLSVPRGIPDDITAVTSAHVDYWLLDAHSASWIDASEIVRLCEWIKYKGWDIDDYFGFLFGSTWRGYETALDVAVEDVRFVFWFDN